MEANDTKGIFVAYLPGPDELILWYQKQVPQAGISNKMNPGYFPLRPLSWNRNKYPCFYIFPLEFLGVGDLHTHTRTEGFYVKTAIIDQLKRLYVPECT